jgi:hypothetical protein
VTVKIYRPGVGRSRVAGYDRCQHVVSSLAGGVMRTRWFTAAFTRRTLLLAASVALSAGVLVGASEAGAQEPLKIAIIGTGRIGGALARHWVNAGHEVFMSSRHPEDLEGLAKELGPRAHVGQPRQAAAFGSIILVSVPYGAMPQIGTDFAAELAGKVIIDTSNPVERRDGPQAIDWQRKGAGVATAELLKNERTTTRPTISARAGGCRRSTSPNSTPTPK